MRRGPAQARGGARPPARGLGRSYSDTRCSPPPTRIIKVRDSRMFWNDDEWK